MKEKLQIFFGLAILASIAFLALGIVGVGINFWWDLF